MSLKRMAVVTSGQGADLQCIIDACVDHQIKAVIDLVASSNSNALGLKRAADTGIDTLRYDKTRHSSSEEFFVELKDRLIEREIDYIISIEFGLEFPNWFIHMFNKKLICIHPSLDFEFIDKENCGLLSANKVIENSYTQTGATAFFVSANCHDYIVISKEKVPVFKEDNVFSIHQRVKKVEHFLIPRLLSKWCAGVFFLDDNETIQIDKNIPEPIVF